MSHYDHLLPEENLSGHIDSSFDIGSGPERSCPACDEELALHYGRCDKDCPCECHRGERHE